MSALLNVPNALWKIALLLTAILLLLSVSSIKPFERLIHTDLRSNSNFGHTAI